MRRSGGATPGAARLACHLAVVVTTVVGAGVLTPGRAEPTRASSYVVELRDGAPIPAVLAGRPVQPTTRFEHALTGFVADLTAPQVQALQHEPTVVDLLPNVPIQVVDAVPAEALGLEDLVGLVDSTVRSVLGLLAPTAPAPSTQVVPNSTRRSGAATSPTARIDGVDQRVDATIAVVDTGIDPSHPDLNVVGGHDCTSGDPTAWADDHGHGTLVAGVAAALDNAFGVVGVAPGAGLLAVKSVDAQGFGTVESLVCGIEWAADPAHGADVINLSLGWLGSSDDQCGAVSGDLIHRAICRAVDRGVTVVAAAGNESMDAAGLLPAAYPEVLTVSGIADFDGAPGGRSAPADCDTAQVDDHFRTTSNFGPLVEIAASASCVMSTTMGGGYGRAGGTSLSAPAVAAAVALLIARDGPLSPDQIRSQLQAVAEPGPIPGDPDRFPEGILDVSSF